MYEAREVTLRVAQSARIDVTLRVGEVNSQVVVQGEGLAQVYTQSSELTFGNSGRNSVNIPHRTNFDMSVYKVFKPVEKWSVQLRAEAFNVFNHTQFSSANSSVSADFLMSLAAPTAGEWCNLDSR